MTFTSVQFAIFFVVLLGLLAVIPSLKAQKVVLLFASYVFYAYFNWRFVALLLALTGVTFYCVWQMRRTERKKPWLISSIGFSLGMLAYFKYANFFLGTLNSALHVRFNLLDVLLPIGISFMVFEVISYAADVYRGDAQYEEDLLDFSLLVAFFPHLISGPILKPNHFLPQLKQPIRITGSNLSAGLQLFVWGMAQKLLVSDRLAPSVDVLFKHPSAFTPLSTWMGVASYALQIYADFNGYTLMAIGAARMMGFEIPQNFNLPYLAANITDFWRRWHISLSTWLRNYLYIPLGGNRKGKWRTYVNLMVVMLLGGLWHGASWNFCLWGGLHGVGLAVHKLWMDLKWGFNGAIAKGIAWALTLVFAVTAWVPFRSQHWDSTMAILKKMYGVDATFQSAWLSSSLIFAIPCLILADAASRGWFNGKRLHLTRFTHQLAFSLIVVGMLPLAPAASSPFIYFQF